MSNLQWACFPADAKEYEHIRQYLLTAAAQSGITIPPARLLKLELGLEEAVINIINYAYEGAGPLWIRVRRTADTLRFDLIDQGQPFNPLTQHRQQTADRLEDCQIGGLGIAFMKHVFQDIRYAYEPFHEQMSNHLSLEFRP